MNSPLPVDKPYSYGNRVCPICSLTVADLLNGRQYHLAPECAPFFHDECYAYFFTLISHFKQEELILCTQ